MTSSGRPRGTHGGVPPRGRPLRAESTMFTNEGYALLIGVDDYSAFDVSRDQTIGTHDLKGSRNDVRAFWKLCRLIGMKPANIRVLASPPIYYRELEGATPETV